MSYMLEILGRGLLGEMFSAFETQLPCPPGDNPADLRQRCAASPRSIDLALRHGTATLRQGELAEARTAFERAACLAPDSPLPSLGLACVFDELGQLDDALEYLRVARRRNPDDAAIAFAIGFCRERRGHAAAARSAYEETVELCPQLRNAHERLAALDAQAGEWRAAALHYEALAELEPSDLDVWLALGCLRLAGGDARAAIESFERALLIEPEPSGRGLTEENEAAGSKSLSRAIAKLEKLVDKFPGVAPFHVHLADLYARAGDTAGAVAHYGAALEAQPGFLEATVKLGTQLLRQGAADEAALTFQQAVELNDRLMFAFVALGVAQHAAGRRRSSLKTFNLAASLEPSSTLLFAEAARLYTTPRAERSRRPGSRSASPADAALHECLRRHLIALRHRPQDAELQYHHALLLRHTGDTPRSRAALQRCLHVQPGFAKAQVKLGLLLLEMGERRRAVRWFQRAVLPPETGWRTQYEFGLLFAQRNRFDRELERFEQERPDSADAALRPNIALALQHLGLIDRTLAASRSLAGLERECALEPGRDALFAED